MERTKSFIETILEKEENNVTLKLKVALDEVYEEARKEITEIVHKTIKEFSVNSLNVFLNEVIELEVDLVDKKLYASNFYDTEFGINLLETIESEFFKNEALKEKVSILLPKAEKYYVFSINK